MSEKKILELEYPVKASASMLYPFLSTPSGLSEWFCEDVNSRGEIFEFIWEGSEETARLLMKKNDRFIRFRWLADEEAGDKSYFEFRIVVDELTNDTSLIVLDHVLPEDEEETRLLWHSQVQQLLHVVGS